MRRRWGVVFVLALALTLGGSGCGRIAPGTSAFTTRYRHPQRPCAESILARANGEYAVELDNPQRPYVTYHASCEKACNAGGGAPVCVEAALLINESGAYSPPLGVSDLVGWCKAADPQACAWVAQNQYQIDAQDRRWADEAAQREYERQLAAAAAEAETAEAGTLVGRGVASITRDSAEAGFNLQSDTTVSLQDTGYASLPLTVQPSMLHMVVLVANSTTRFTSTIGGDGVDGSSALEVIDVNPGLFVLSSQFNYQGAGGTTTRVGITADGGDRGDVRVLFFAKWK